jgi:beta-galactosidase
MSFRREERTCRCTERLFLVGILTQRRGGAEKSTWRMLGVLGALAVDPVRLSQALDRHGKSGGFSQGFYLAHMCSAPRLLVAIGLLFSAVWAHAQRDTISLNTDWRFTVDPQDIGMKQAWYRRDLSNARMVVVPHTWNTDSLEQHHYGRAWYQRSLPIPVEWRGKHLELVFGAVNHSAIIFLNGKKVAEHIGDGFNRFTVPLEGVKYGRDNRITVAVDNAYGRNKVPFGSSFDWPNDGGIIRPVVLIVTGRPHVERIQTTAELHLADSTGTLRVELEFPRRQDLELRVKITEENQATHSTVLEQELAPEWSGHAAILHVALGKVHPWHFDRPNLYRVEVAMIADGKAVDRVTTDVGFRKLEFQEGRMLLNGEAVKLVGVEWTAGSNPDYGLAEPDSLVRAMGRLMKEVNCVLTRQHFQQGEAFYDFCDRHGMLVQQELPLWGPETPANDTIRRIAMRQLEDMVHDLHDHPSIFAWGVGNELRARDADMKYMVADLLARARALDPTRAVSYVSNSLTQGFAGQPGFVPDAAADGDLLMMNEYGGSWWPIPQGAIGPYLDSIHTSYPARPFFISEFGLCEPNFTGGDARRIRDMTYHWAVYESKPWIQGAIYFDLTDYRTHYPGTAEQGRFRRRVHGVYDMYGQAKPSAAVLRELASPVEVQSLRRGQPGKLEVGLMGNIGLPEYAALGYTLYLSDSTGRWQGTKAYSLPVIKPGRQVVVEVDDAYQGKGVVTILRPGGYVAIVKSFYWQPEEQ